MVGRPSKYTKALADEICERLAKGEPMAQICRDAHMPAPSTVWEWEKVRPGFSEKVARARKDGFDQIALDAINIADDADMDTIYVGKAGTPIPDKEWIARSKLRVETRLKLLACWDPRRYGQKSAVELTGADSGPLKLEMIHETLADRIARIAQARGSQIDHQGPVEE